MGFGFCFFKGKDCLLKKISVWNFSVIYVIIYASEKFDSINQKKHFWEDSSIILYNDFSIKLCCWILYIPVKNSSFWEFVYSNRKAFHSLRLIITAWTSYSYKVNLAGKREQVEGKYTLRFQRIIFLSGIKYGVFSFGGFYAVTCSVTEVWQNTRNSTEVSMFLYYIHLTWKLCLAFATHFGGV